MAHSKNSIITRALAKSVGGYARMMMEPPSQLAFDYSQPHGEEGLVPHDSVSWRIDAEGRRIKAKFDPATLERVARDGDDD